MFKEYIKIALRDLRTRKINSWLTVIGVVIGVFLVISLLSLSEGLKEAVLSQLRMMGKDIVMVYPGDASNMMTMMAGGSRLSDDNLRIIENTKGVAVVIPVNWKAEVMEYKDKKKTILLYGNPWRKALDIYKNDMGWSLKDGRWPVPGKDEIIIGSLISTEIFPGIRTGAQVNIQGRKFQVVGILKSVGNKQDDSMVAVDLDIFKSITGERKGARFAFAKIESGFSAKEMAKRIEDNLNKQRKRKRNEDSTSFTVLTSEKVTSIVGNVIGLIEAIILGFASIAIVVGGIGIMNTMYTSVREKIREIGVMKAVGAKKSAITTIFLIESGFFGLVGGIGGIILGILFAKMVEVYFQFGSLFYLKASITPQLILFGLLFSFLVGGISGYFPARNAAKLNPVDALRYE